MQQNQDIAFQILEILAILAITAILAIHKALRLAETPQSTYLGGRMDLREHI